MSEHSEIFDGSAQDGDDADSDYLRPLQLKRNRKSTAGTRKILHKWTDDEIIRLIDGVEKHRELWDMNSSKYKLENIRQGWRELVDELGVANVDVTEAKVKWCSLRTTYMVNLGKLKNTQGANKTHTVAWKFFNPMTFLGTKSMKYSAPKKSKLQLASATNDISIANEFMDSSQASTSEFLNAQQSKFQSTTTSTPPLSPSPSADSYNVQADPLTNSIKLHLPDVNSAFCNHLLAELRTLSDTRARTLRYKISRLMMNFIEEFEEPAQASSIRASMKSENGDLSNI